MKRVKLINCSFAKENNTGVVVNMYETAEEAIASREAWVKKHMLKDKVISYLFKLYEGVGVVESNEGVAIQVYDDEFEEIIEDILPV